jgi:hypothetical protein
MAPKPRDYTLDELLGIMKIGREQAIEIVRTYNLTDAMTAYRALVANEYIPADMREGNFMELYCQLLGVSPTWGPVFAPANNKTSF